MDRYYFQYQYNDGTKKEIEVSKWKFYYEYILGCLILNDSVRKDNVIQHKVLWQ